MSGELRVECEIEIHSPIECEKSYGGCNDVQDEKPDRLSFVQEDTAVIAMPINLLPFRVDS